MNRAKNLSNYKYIHIYIYIYICIRMDMHICHINVLVAFFNVCRS
jgi:hypothetical protein